MASLLSGAKYSFIESNGDLPSFAKPETQQLLLKWGLKDTLRSYRFQFDQPFRPYDGEILLTDFFNSPIVQACMKVLYNEKGTWGSLSGKGKPLFKRLPCSFTSMSFFDRLYDCGVLRPSGHINGCIPEVFEGINIDNELSNVLLVDGSDNYAVFSPEDRSEFLFRLFTHLVVGGTLNQYDDFIAAYFDLTKALYKDLVTVSKDPETKQIIVTSPVFAVSGLEGFSPQLFPCPNNSQSCCYVSINATSRVVSVLYNAWVS